ncbi:MAG: DUF1800 domain-containing protein [Gemmatimonadota bacterium]
MDKRLRALNRFGLGARVGERDRISDGHGWLRGQLDSGPPALRAPAGNSPSEIADALRNLRMMQGGEQDRREARRKIVQLASAEQRAALTERATTTRPFVERLVGFWSNHLCVSAAAKLPVSLLAGSYERDVIRPHVLGRFEDMVLASAKHPAMLLYLDNFQSIGPNSRGARAGGRLGRQRGLNENYARELLELHTLGVNGGYTQNDVLELARILTGWSTDREIRFEFRELAHEPSAKTLLGIRYEEAGLREGERAMRALSRHPATSTFIATKLVTHFVADQPTASAVDRIARVFRTTDGDLHAVSAALIDLPEAWSEAARKFRTPQDWLVAVLRAFDARDASEALSPVLRQLRHPLWAPQAPKGFGDTTQEWADPDALLNRGELARTIARQTIGKASGAGFAPQRLLEVVDVANGNPLQALLADNSIPADERIALAIAGPAFQWR